MMGTVKGSPDSLPGFRWMSLMDERTRIRSELDGLSDFVTDGKTVDFRKELRSSNPMKRTVWFQTKSLNVPKCC